MGDAHGGSHRALLNQGEEAEMEMFGYKTRGVRRALCVAGHLFSFGGLLLLFSWKPEWDVWANCAPCGLEEADVVLLRTTDEFRVYTRKKVTWVSLPALHHLAPDHPALAEDGSLLSKVIMKPELKVRCLRVQKVCHAWDTSAKRFLKVGALEEGLTCAEIHAKFGAGLNREEQDLRRTICGPNTIDVEITPIWKLLFKEVLNPFYVFQLFSVCLWLSEDYIEYSVAIILMSLLSVSLTVYDLRKQSVKLHRLVESHDSVRVRVGVQETGVPTELESRCLVPGDLLVLGGGRSLLPCDAVLVSGQCTVNEGMLTGESIPVTKTALPFDPKDRRPWAESCAEDQRRHLLFCGTELIQAKGVGKGPARAVVLRTGFNTAKGDLVRSILYPKPLNFRLYRDALRFLMCLIGVAAIGMIYAVCVFTLSGEVAGEVIKKALDVITIAVPPALPAALTTGIIYAQRRLKKRGIFCISPQRINVCGQINLFCFDKTGTLTEDGLDLWGAVLAEGKSFRSAHRFSSSAAASPLPWGPAFAAMATCHSLVVLDGKIQGDPLDLKMFQATQWEIEDSSSNDGDGGESAQVLVVRPGAKAEQVVPGGGGLAVLRQFPFSSALQRMSVVVREPSGRSHVFMKGAPEKVAAFCRPETVPSSFTSELQLHTSRGFRVIGLAHKSLPEGTGTGSLNRDEVESGLTFLGLLVLENRLKGQTRPVLEELRDARIRTVMVTGDNIQTAITVAKDAGMIPPGSQAVLVEADALDGQPSITWSPLGESKGDAFGGAEESCMKVGGGGGRYHFCLSGGSYEAIGQHFSHLLPGILLNGTVFARMSPAQKAKLVQDFQKLDYFVGMCGDGANDCGALKVAHAGISLSEQEASVASPFTSQVPNIQCVPELVRQGRAALVTSFCMFKYMALYSMIQYIGVLLLYWQTKAFGNYQFLFQDLAINTLIGLTMSLSGAHRKLVPFRPPARLTSPPLLLSMVLNLLFSLAAQVCGFVLVQRQPWYLHEDFLRACAPSNVSSPEAPFLANLTLGPAREAPPATPREEEEDFRSYENTSVWLLSTISCLMVAVVFSKGKPFRKPIYQNYLFVLVLVVQLAVCLFLLFANVEDLYVRMELVCTPTLWRVSLLIMLLVNFAVSFVVEEAIIENRALWRLLKRAFGYQSTSQYKKLQRSLNGDPSWPPLNKMDFSGATAIHMDVPGATYINPGFESHGEPACSLRL